MVLVSRSPHRSVLVGALLALLLGADGPSDAELRAMTGLELLARLRRRRAAS
jgi:hypothetical protein